MLALLLNVSSRTIDLRLEASASSGCHPNFRFSVRQPRKSLSSWSSLTDRTRGHRRKSPAALDHDHEVINVSSSRSPGPNTGAPRRTASATANPGAHPSSSAGTTKESVHTADGDLQLDAGGAKPSKWKRDRSGSQWARSVYRCSILQFVMS